MSREGLEPRLPVGGILVLSQMLAHEFLSLTLAMLNCQRFGNHLATIIRMVTETLVKYYFEHG